MHRRRSTGFTLIEAIIAIVLLSISVPPMVWSLRQAHVQRVNPMMASQARWLATERLEDVIADRHSTLRGYDWVINANYAAEASVTGFPAFARSVNIVERAANLVSAGTGYKRITVTVSWTDATGVARNLAVATVVTEYGSG